MSTLGLVPLPTSLRHVPAAPFPLRATTAFAGDADALSELRDLVTARLGDPSIGSDAAHPTGTITASIEPGGPAESYRLSVDAEEVTVVGADPAGLFYGIQTLAQLITLDGEEATIPAVVIEDAPRFSYRGVMLDVARHFFDVDTVCAFIDRAARLKFNALHLHLSDDQGWCIEIHARPLLTERASGSSVGGGPGGFFSQDDYARIIAYAASRHMLVVPEIDVPGHTHAVSIAYPELNEQPVLSDHILQILRDYGGQAPVNATPYDAMAVGFSSLRIHDEATYDFLQEVFGELAAITPGPYLHLGGDEALGTSPEDFALFMARASEIVAATGKTPITWHEAGAAPELTRGTVGQYWGFVTPTDGMDAKARTFPARGGSLILSPADAIYLDMKPHADSPLGLVWANGPTSLHRAYQWDPATVIDGVGDEQILGIEASLWTETVTDLADIDALVFPRVAAAAEAGWSVPLGSAPERSWESFQERVHGLEPLWRSLGITLSGDDTAADAS